MNQSISVVDHPVFKMLYASDEAKQHFQDTRVNLPPDMILKNSAFMKWIMKNDTVPKLQYDVIHENLEDLRDEWHPDCARIRSFTNRLLDAAAEHQKAAALFANFDLHLKILNAYYTSATTDTKVVNLFRTTDELDFEEYIDEGLFFHERDIQKGLRMHWKNLQRNYDGSRAVLRSVKESGDLVSHLNLLYSLVQQHRTSRQLYILSHNVGDLTIWFQRVAGGNRVQHGSEERR